MKTSQRMASIITKIANQFDFDLEAEFGHLRIGNGPMQDLVIEKHGKDTVAVLHIASDGAYDPMIRFHIYRGMPAFTWHPIEIQMAWNGRLRCLAEEQEDGSWRINKFAQADAASFANDWATNIKDQEYIKGELKLKFQSQSDTAWLIMPDESVMFALPKHQEMYLHDPDITPADTSFSLRELYNVLDCNMVEVSRQTDDFLFVGDEEGKLYDEWELNKLATRLARLDRKYLSMPEWGGDAWAGRCLLTPSKWFR